MGVRLGRQAAAVRSAALLVAALGLAVPQPWARGSGPQAPATEQACPPAESRRRPLPPAAAAEQAGADIRVPDPDPAGADYRHRLRPTPYGWPRRDHWCLWIEPGASAGPAARWDQAWAGAVAAAVSSWQELLPLTVVSDPERAQVLVWRRRPPLRGGRASHGRAELALLVVQRRGELALEPQVSVSISPGQRPEAMEATALHELGHAFGLWGHSDDPADAMAAVPGATPVRRLSRRDRATLHWLQQQPGLVLRPGAGTGSGSAGPAGS
ncbi:MAG: peptidase [Prochlorococcaceae cyanobacterium]